MNVSWLQHANKENYYYYMRTIYLFLSASLSGLKAMLTNCLHTCSQLSLTLNAKNICLFYYGILLILTNTCWVMPRSLGTRHLNTLVFIL